MGTDDRLPDRPGADDPGRGRRIGIDVGTVRIGVASSDPDGILATPVETVARDKRDKTGKHVRRLAALVKEYEAVGDRASASAHDAVDVAEQLARRIAPTPVRLADERLTTVSAQRSLREAGVRARGQKAVIDQVAAVGILQGWLDQRRAALAARREGTDG